MNKFLKKNSLIRYSRQIILKKIGIVGQKKIKKSKILIVGVGGLGCPVADLLTRSGVGVLGLIDFDKVDLSNIHRQTLYSNQDIGKCKVKIAKKKLNLINKEVKIDVYNKKADEKTLKKIINKYEIIVDGSDNFKTKFLLNKISIKFKKKLIVGAISKFDGHVFTFDFNSKKSSCLKCFYQSEPDDELLNCETEGILGSTANIVGSIQANEVLKTILNIGNNLKSNILILDLLNLNFRKVLFKKRKGCIC
tara:strand:- start:412 stop:1161 length:750 start_codon:yes stop_codon:yes gene_type:complete